MVCVVFGFIFYYFCGGRETSYTYTQQHRAFRSDRRTTQGMKGNKEKKECKFCFWDFFFFCCLGGRGVSGPK